jgi:hypothetical protein
MLAFKGHLHGHYSDAIAYLAEKGFDPQFGAEPVKRVIQTFLISCPKGEFWLAISYRSIHSLGCI